jgi:hypothetical protein
MTTPLTIRGSIGTGRRSATGPAAPPGRVPRVARLLALALRCERLVADGAVAGYGELARLGHVSRARVRQVMALRHRRLRVRRTTGGRLPHAARLRAHRRHADAARPAEGGVRLVAGPAGRSRRRRRERSRPRALLTVCYARGDHGVRRAWLFPPSCLCFGTSSLMEAEAKAQGLAGAKLAAHRRPR